MVWTPDPVLGEQLVAAHSQLARWRRDGDPEKIAFWYLRRDELLEQVVRSKTLAETDPELAAHLRVSACTRILKAHRR